LRTTKHTTVLIIFPLNLQTTVTAQILVSTGGQWAEHEGELNAWKPIKEMHGISSTSHKLLNNDLDILLIYYSRATAVAILANCSL